MLALLLWFFFIGIIAGFLARAIVPGRDPIGFWGTVLLGIIGSFVGGFLADLVFGGVFLIRPSGIIGSVIGAVIALLIYRAAVGRRIGVEGSERRMVHRAARLVDYGKALEVQRVDLPEPGPGEV